MIFLYIVGVSSIFWRQSDTDSCSNEYSSADCALVSNGNYCYIYANECKKSCGCHFPFERRRKIAGLKTYSEEEMEGKGCKVGHEWHDKFHFSCRLYEGARWCERMPSGEVVEGPEWCNWLDVEDEKTSPDPCLIQKALRWPNHDDRAYANVGFGTDRSGTWAQSCCCNTGIAEAYPYENDNLVCTDKKKSNPETGLQTYWHDTNGYNCRAYYFGDFCTADGGTGEGWDVAEYGEIYEYVFQDMSPYDACCACGGGIHGPEYDTGLEETLKIRYEYEDNWRATHGEMDESNAEMTESNAEMDESHAEMTESHTEQEMSVILAQDWQENATRLFALVGIASVFGFGVKTCCSKTGDEFKQIVQTESVI